MKPAFIIALLSLCISSCKEKPSRVSNKPKWVLDENKMVDIITDLRIVDASTYINTGAPPRDKSKDWHFVMKKHHVVDSIFRKSHDYYSVHPEVAERIYEQVIDRLSEMQADNTDGQ